MFVHVDTRFSFCCMFRLITEFVLTWTTWRVPHVEQDLTILSERLILSVVFGGVCVAQWLVFFLKRDESYQRDNQSCVLRNVVCLKLSVGSLYTLLLLIMKILELHLPLSIFYRVLCTVVCLFVFFCHSTVSLFSTFRVIRVCN